MRYLSALCSFLITAIAYPSTAPSQINGAFISVRVVQNSGYFTDGDLAIYIPEEGNSIYLASLTYGQMDFGTYSYQATGDTGQITINPNGGGSLSYQIKFNTDAAGEFAVDSLLGTQSGFFELAWLYNPDEVEAFKFANVVRNVESNQLTIEFEVETSEDLKNWSQAQGDWQVGENGKLSFKPSETTPSKFFRIVSP